MDRPNASQSPATNRARITRTTGPSMTRKSTYPRCALLAIMMLGGSPTRVAVPPMFEATAAATRNGTGLSSNRFVISSVTGAMRRTVVTLSSMAERPAVINDKSTIMRKGRAFACCAAQMARTSNNPVLRVMLMMTIMPMRRKMTL